MAFHEVVLPRTFGVVQHYWVHVPLVGVRFFDRYQSRLGEAGVLVATSGFLRPHDPSWARLAVLGSPLALLWVWPELPTLYTLRDAARLGRPFPTRLAWPGDYTLWSLRGYRNNQRTIIDHHQAMLYDSEEETDMEW